MTATSSHAVQNFFLSDESPGRSEHAHLQTPVEPALDAVLSFVQTYSDPQLELAEPFAGSAADPMVRSPALFQYCLHVLQWPEVRQQVSDWLVIEKNDRTRQMLRLLLESSDDAWLWADECGPEAGAPVALPVAGRGLAAKPVEK